MAAVGGSNFPLDNCVIGFICRFNSGVLLQSALDPIATFVFPAKVLDVANRQRVKSNPQIAVVVD